MVLLEEAFADLAIRKRPKGKSCRLDSTSGDNDEKGECGGGLGHRIIQRLLTICIAEFEMGGRLLVDFCTAEL